VRFGICLDSRRPWDDLLRLARHADDANLARIYLADHFMPYDPATPVAGSVHECWTTLSALAVATSRIGLGTLVLGNTYRHPAVVANMAATLDQVSRGRLLLGLGAGWQPNEHRAYGIELRPPARRIDCFAEALEIVSLLLRSDVSSFDGAYYSLEEARCEPSPVQTPMPLLVGGAGERRSIPLAARYADAWHAWTTPTQFVHKCQVLDSACAAAGREPSDVERFTGQVLRVLAHGEPVDDATDIVGTAGFVTQRLAAYDEARVDEFIVRDHAATSLPDAIESLDLLASDVIPALR
jgi:F420-dependent oxidoreductase-like protein